MRVFFGDGKHYDNQTMKSEFKKSDILGYAINETIQYIEKMKGKHYEWFLKTCKKYNKKPDRDGVTHILVEQRGNLSHFSLANSNKQRNTFKDKDYESLAFMAMTICMFSSIKLRIEPFRQKALSR